jgi:dTDP-L-rhamnose 4-epimerase
MSDVLITGGAGFIGKYLSLCLAAAGHRVTVFDNLNPQVHVDGPGVVDELRRAGVRFIAGDVRDAAALATVLTAPSPEIVIHLAAETGTGQSHDLPVHYCDVNVTGTARLLEAVRSAASSDRRPRRVILAGSRAVYGEGAGSDPEGRLVTAMPRLSSDMARGDFAPRDAKGRAVVPAASAAASTHPAPASIYASTKLMQEHLLTQGLEQTGIACIILRLQNVYGAGQSLGNPYTGVLSIFARRLLDGGELDIYEDGAIIRDFVHVSDVVAAFRRVCEMERIASQTLDIGSGRPVTIAEVASIMADQLSLDRARLRVTGRFRPGDVRHALADISAAKSVLDWSPAIDLRDGVAELLAWARAMGMGRLPSG